MQIASWPVKTRHPAVTLVHAIAKLDLLQAFFEACRKYSEMTVPKIKSSLPKPCPCAEPPLFPGLYCNAAHMLRLPSSTLTRVAFRLLSQGLTIYLVRCVLLYSDAVLEDVHLVWSNCRQYNTIQDSFILKACAKAEQKFNKLWSDAQLPEFMSGRAGSSREISTRAQIEADDRVADETLDVDISADDTPPVEAETQNAPLRARKLKIIPPRAPEDAKPSVKTHGPKAKRGKDR